MGKKYFRLFNELKITKYILDKSMEILPNFINEIRGKNKR